MHVALIACGLALHLTQTQDYTNRPDGFANSITVVGEAVHRSRRGEGTGIPARVQLSPVRAWLHQVIQDPARRRASSARLRLRPDPPRCRRAQDGAVKEARQQRGVRAPQRRPVGAVVPGAGAVHAGGHGRGGDAENREKALADGFLGVTCTDCTKVRVN